MVVSYEELVDHCGTVIRYEEDGGVLVEFVTGGEWVVDAAACSPTTFSTKNHEEDSSEASLSF